MSQYPAPPPSYGSSPQKPYRDDEAASPLLGTRSQAGPSNGIYDQPVEGDLPDDFKVSANWYTFSISLIGERVVWYCCSGNIQYGTTVSDSSPEIRNAFVRKVYSILCESICFVLALEYRSHRSLQSVRLQVDAAMRCLLFAYVWYSSQLALYLEDFPGLPVRFPGCRRSTSSHTHLTFRSHLCY